MNATIVLPTALRSHCNNNRDVEVEADAVGEALENLVVKFPDLRPHLLDSNGLLLGYVNVFTNDKNIRDLDDLNTEIHDGDEILIVPALAGG